ncbi:MAG: amino acid permease [Steroidobacteraceae bacterium]
MTRRPSAESIPKRSPWRVKVIDDLLHEASRKSLGRSLGGMQLMLLGIGNVIGSGIFVLTADAAQKAGPAMLIAFLIAGAVCALTALCYTEMAAMVPVSGSAYTYSYVVFGEFAAWIVGWGLIAEWALSAAAVAAGWSSYFAGLAHDSLGWNITAGLTTGPLEGGVVNLPAVVVSLCMTGLLYLGTRESAAVNAALVAIKVLALVAFAALTIPAIKSGNFHPFAPQGFLGVSAAASTIFFTYVGFDAVSTAAEEARDPQRNLAIGLIGSLVICGALFVVVAIGAIGTAGAQPIVDPATGAALPTGSLVLAHACQLPAHAGAFACSSDALAHVLRAIGSPKAAMLIAAAAFIALPTVILTGIYAQSRIFFGMARDGLLPSALVRIHPRFRTPHIVVVATGLAVAVAAAFLPVGRLADISNAGALLAFMLVSLGVLLLRRSQPERARPFRVPLASVTCPLAILGCVYLCVTLDHWTQLAFLAWCVLGALVYLCYGVRHSSLARGRPR